MPVSAYYSTALMKNNIDKKKNGLTSFIVGLESNK
jgi:hypothetical protein